MSFENKRVVVTGAASGIGLATVWRFAAEGARVAMIDRDEGVLEAAAEVPGAFAVRASVADEEELSPAFAELVERLGGLDVAVSCAGVQLFGEDAAVAELESGAWERTLGVNLTGTFLTAKHAIGAMLAGGVSGSLVCVGSPTGMRGSAPGFSAYSASKAGVIGLVRVLCGDYGRHGIRVNAVVPGFTETPLVREILADEGAVSSIVERIPLGRSGRPTEIVAAIAFLASDEASYVTGAVLAADGGFTAV